MASELKELKLKYECLTKTYNELAQKNIELFEVLSRINWITNGYKE